MFWGALILVAVSFIAGMLVGRKNPSLADATAKVAASAAAQAAAAAKKV